MLSEPFKSTTIHNRHTGETLTFTHMEDNRLYAAGGAAPNSPGAPMHVHRWQEEVIEVVAGKMGYALLDGVEHITHAGDVASFPPGQAHRWWNASDQPLVTRGYVSPPLHTQYFLTQIFESSNANSKSAPLIWDAAFLLTRYRDEYDMLEIPPFVKRYFFPILVRVGHLLGKYDKFKDAP